MSFKKHYEIEGKHAFLSPSKYSWLNYTDFASVYIMANALIENYCALRDDDYKRLLTMVTGE